MSVVNMWKGRAAVFVFERVSVNTYDCGKPRKDADQ